MVDSDHRLVGWDNDHFQTVDRLELERLSIGRTGHTREVAVEAEEVLERN